MYILDQIIAVYNSFISIFPPQVQWIVSLLLFIAIVIGVLNLIRQNFIWLILLIILLPASIPILQSIFNGIIAFLQYLL